MTQMLEFLSEKDFKTYYNYIHYIKKVETWKIYGRSKLNLRDESYSIRNEKYKQWD